MRAFESASASKRRARRSFSDTIAAPSPNPWKAGATMPSAKTSAKGSSASTLRKPQSSPLGDSTTAKSRARSTLGAVQRPRSQSASMTGTPMNATHSSFEKAATSAASTSCGDRIRKPGSSSIAPVCRTRDGRPVRRSGLRLPPEQASDDGPRSANMRAVSWTFRLSSRATTARSRMSPRRVTPRRP
jgi:hypothetical protein